MCRTFPRRRSTQLWRCWVCPNTWWIMVPFLRWCNSDQQLADGMTKISAQDRTAQFLKNHQRWNLLYDETFTAAQKLMTAKTADEFSDAHRDQSWLGVLNQTSGHVRNYRNSATAMSSSLHHSNMSHHGSMSHFHHGRSNICVSVSATGTPSANSGNCVPT